MKVRRLFAALAAVVMLAQPVLAAEHEIYLSNGSLTIDTGSYSQTNGNSGTYNQGDKIVVKGNQQETSNTITVTSGANPTIVLDNVNINVSSGSGIDVNAGASANIELVGDNTVKTKDYDAAAIHGGVDSGDELTITSDSGGSLKAEHIGAGAGAGIGTNSKEELAGKIAIQGNANVTAKSYAGSGIGSGLSSNMSGNITIGENATVDSTSEWGAGIGSGADGNMTGNIAIQDKAKVTVGSSHADPIGAGNGGSSEKGKISYGLYTEVKKTDGTYINKPASKPTPPAPSAPAAKLAPVSLSRVYDEETQTYYVEHWTELDLTLSSEDVDVPEELSKEGDTLIRSVNLTAEGSLPNSFTLGFELGEEFAGKTVEIRHVGADGEVKTVRMVADGEGTVTMNAKELGTYVLVEV